MVPKGWCNLAACSGGWSRVHVIRFVNPEPSTISRSTFPSKQTARTSPSISTLSASLFRLLEPNSLRIRTSYPSVSPANTVVTLPHWWCLRCMPSDHDCRLTPTARCLDACSASRNVFMVNALSTCTSQCNLHDGRGRPRLPFPPKVARMKSPARVYLLPWLVLSIPFPMG